MNSTVVRERQPVVAPLEARERVRWWVPLAIFGAVAVVLWLVAGLSAANLARTEQYSPAPEHFVGGALFEPWARWDAAWYRSIVLDGYVYYPGVQSSVAFWPSYPLVLNLLEPVSPSPFVSGSLVTLLSGAASAVLFFTWCARWLSRRAATMAVLLLVLFPFAWYLYGPVYADALALAAILAAFVSLERDRLWLAGLFGLVASASRPIGVVFAVALVLRLVERRNEARVAELARRSATGREVPAPDGATPPPAPLGVRVAETFVERLRGLAHEAAVRFSPRSLRWSDTRVLLAFGGFLAWCAYLWVEFGDPLLWQHIQSVPGWDQGSGPSTWFKFFLLDQVVGDASSPFTWSKVGQGLLAFGMLALIPRVAHRFGWAYAAYTLGVILVPVIGTKDFMGTGRYLLVAFPVFAVAGEWLVSKPRLRVATLAGSGALLVFLTVLFARGHYLA